MASPSLKKETKMGIKALVGKKMSKNVKFMGEDVKINKLSVEEVLDIQERAKAIDGESQDGLMVLRTVVRAAVEDANELTDEEFATFPMDELAKLSQEIMKFSGLGAEQGK